MSAALGAGAAANFVGGTMQAVAAGLASKKMGKAYQREMQLQEKFRNQSLNEFQTALPLRGVEQARSDIATGRANREQGYQEANAAPFSADVGVGPQGRDSANLNLMGGLRAQLAGYSDWGLENLIRNLRSQERLNQISNFAKGWADVFPAKMYDAQHSQDELAMWGQLIAGLGGGAQGYSQLFGSGPQGGGGMGGGFQGDIGGGEFAGQV